MIQKSKSSSVLLVSFMILVVMNSERAKDALCQLVQDHANTQSGQ
jgi:hypothetical protein